MLMPVGLKGKDKEKYVKENARLLVKGKPRTRANKHVGLRQPKKQERARSSR